MQESFPTPGHTGDIIASCEDCGNFLYIREKEIKKVFPCPICGCLNKIERSAKGAAAKGHIVLTSALMTMNRGELESGLVSLPELPEKVQEALVWLQSHGWRVNFVEETEPDDEKT